MAAAHLQFPNGRLGDCPCRANEFVDRVGDHAIAVRRGVLISQSRLRRDVTEPMHELLRSGSCRSGECGRDVPQIMEVEPLQADFRPSLDPVLLQTCGRRNPPWTPVNTSPSGPAAA